MGHVIEADTPYVDSELGAVIVKQEGPWIVMVSPMIFNDRVQLCHERTWRYFITAGWCYDKGGAAMLAAQAWNPLTEHEPVGYKKVPHPDPRKPMSDSVWIKTEPSLDGQTYVVTIEADDDTAVTLTTDGALCYARTIFDAAQRAIYDAAVMKQIGALVDTDAAGQLLKDLRADRPPLDPKATHPLSVEPGVSAFTGEPFLMVMINGKRAGQWSPSQAHGHALGVLEAVAVADLDSGYYRALISHIGLDEPRARQVVNNVSRHREETHG